MRLKTGDKVRRIKRYCDSWWKEACQPPDKILTITHIDKVGNTTLEGIMSDWDVSYFEKVKVDKIKVKDLL